MVRLGLEWQGLSSRKNPVASTCLVWELLFLPQTPPNLPSLKGNRWRHQRGVISAVRMPAIVIAAGPFDGLPILKWGFMLRGKRHECHEHSKK